MIKETISGHLLIRLSSFSYIFEKIQSFYLIHRVHIQSNIGSGQNKIIVSLIQLSHLLNFIALTYGIIINTFNNFEVSNIIRKIFDHGILRDMSHWSLIDNNNQNL